LLDAHAGHFTRTSLPAGVFLAAASRAGICGPGGNFFALFSTGIQPNRAVFGTFVTVFRTFFDACLARILDFESKSGFFARQRPGREFARPSE
jgi:hypothetical protein